MGEVVEDKELKVDEDTEVKKPKLDEVEGFETDEETQARIKQHPIVWHGFLDLKKDFSAVQVHYVFGNLKMATDALPELSNIASTLKISQRMKLDEMQLRGLQYKMTNEHCILLALPSGSGPHDVVKNSIKLKNGLIAYLEMKDAAGIVNISDENHKPAFLVHIFPPACEFSKTTLTSKAPYLAEIVSGVTHLVMVITTD